MFKCEGKLAEAVRSSVEEWGVGHAESFVGKCMDVCLGVRCACMKKAEMVSGGCWGYCMLCVRGFACAGCVWFLRCVREGVLEGLDVFGFSIVV